MKAVKRLSALLLALLLTFGFAATALADSTVQYVGDAEKFIFAPGSPHSPTDLFENFKNAMPGDTLTQTIHISNELKNNVKIELYLRSLGAQEDTESFISKLKLSVKQLGDSNLYAAPDESVNMAQPSDWVYLGTIYSGGDIDLGVTLEIPLEEVGNEYRKVVGYVDWEFKVEEIPVSPDDPVPPVTGDLMINTWLSIVMLVCLAAVVALVLVRRKNKQKAAH